MQKDIKTGTLRKLYLIAYKSGLSWQIIYKTSSHKLLPVCETRTMKINYKIKKGKASYLWRGEGMRWFKARFKKSTRFIKNNLIELLVTNYSKI